MNTSVISPSGLEILPSLHAREDYKRTPFVDHRLELSTAAKQHIQGMPTPWGWPGLSEALYYRSYSREMKNGKQETWADTTIRYIEGVLSIKKDFHLKRRLPWDEGRWRAYGAEMAFAAMDFQWSPPGRGIWAMGTDYVYERGAASLTNCAYVHLDVGDDLAHALGWAMDMLMCGAGVGFGVSSKHVPCQKPWGTPVVYDIPDTREGWIESYELLVRSYLNGSRPIIFTYGRIRPEGSPLKGIGGTASGPGPLIQIHGWVREAFERYLAGDFGATRLKADLANFLGVCVSMGGIRRSSEILLGSIHDDEFINLKNYDLSPERGAWGWASNNTVVLKEHEDFLALPKISDGMRRNGEPGIANLLNMQKYARFGREKPDKADGLNPCQAAWAPVLTPEGIRLFEDITVGSIIWSGQRWTKVVQKVMTGVKPVFAYKTRAGTFYGTKEHRIIQEGERVEVQDASTIDVSSGPLAEASPTDPQDVMDGMMLGDGTVHQASGNLIYLLVGNKDHDYFSSEIKDLFIEDRSRGFASKKDGIQAWIVKTTVKPSELPATYKRQVPERFYKGSSAKVRGFLRGLFTANGSVVGKESGSRVTLKASSFIVIEAVQEMLSSLGIRSYYTTNKAHDVEFENGTYLCRESYDLNVSADRHLFADLIGFLQPYKTQRLAASIKPKSQVHGRKDSFEIVSVEPRGEQEVYDITVEAAEHTYWTGGLLVSNCGEICLEPFETCIVNNTYPSRCKSFGEFARAARYATAYNSIITLLPYHRPETNQIVGRNRRIGVSIAGLADWLHATSDEHVTRALRDVYKQVRDENEKLALEAGIPPSIRLTTMKPDGSVAKLPGVSEGAHAHKFPFSIRRMSVKKDHPIVPILKAAGYPWEPTATQPHLEVNFEFPISAPDGARTTKTQTIWEQLSIAVMMQREWADNAVSITGEFDPVTEGEDVVRATGRSIPMLKSFSVLPRSAGVYKQMPYEEITKEEFEKRRSVLKPLDMSGFHGDGEDERFCQGGLCTTPIAPKH